MTEPGLDRASHTEAWEQVLTGYVPALMVVAGVSSWVGRVEEDQFPQSKIGVLCPEGGEHIVSDQKPTQMVGYRWLAKFFFSFLYLSSSELHFCCC